MYGEEDTKGFTVVKVTGELKRCGAAVEKVGRCSLVEKDLDTIELSKAIDKEWENDFTAVPKRGSEDSVDDKSLFCACVMRLTLDNGS